MATFKINVRLELEANEKTIERAISDNALSLDDIKQGLKKGFKDMLEDEINNDDFDSWIINVEVE